MSDRTKLGLAIVSTLACLGLVFSYPTEAAESVVWHWGIWALWASIGVAAYGVWLARERLRALPWFDRRGIILTGVISVLMHVHYPHQFKILGDEMVLIGVSKSIHEEREPVTPATLQDVGGTTKINIGFLDKRPFFFPLVVSVLHDLTGYRPANSLILNAVLTPVFVYLIFVVAWWITRHPPAGYAAIGLVAGVPLFAHNATGGGFELTNLILILLLFLWAVAYTREGDPVYQVGLVATAVLLAYTRYESVVYLAVPVVAVLAVWLRQRTISLNLVAALSPVLVIPLGCIFRVVAANSALWFQLKDKGSSSAFAWSFLPANLPSALNFFFDDENLQLGSRWVSAVCAIGVPFALIALLRAVRARRSAFAYWAPVSVALVILGNFVLLLSYHWGQLDDYLVSRLTIPFYVLVIVGAVAAATAAKHRKYVLGALGLVALYSVYSVAIPTATKNHYGNSYRAARELEAVQRFLHDFRHPDKLVITDRPLYWTCYGIWTRNIRFVFPEREMIENWLRTGHYPKIYVVQNFHPNEAGMLVEPEPHQKVPADWILTEVARRRIFDNDVLIFSEVHLPPELARGRPPAPAPTVAPSVPAPSEPTVPAAAPETRTTAPAAPTR